MPLSDTIAIGIAQQNDAIGARHPPAGAVHHEIRDHVPDAW
jgi:hypothetical protein